MVFFEHMLYSNELFSKILIVIARLYILLYLDHSVKKFLFTEWFSNDKEKQSFKKLYFYIDQVV